MPVLAHVVGVPLEEMAAYAAPAFALGLSALAACLRGMIAARLPAGRPASGARRGLRGGAHGEDERC